MQCVYLRRELDGILAPTCSRDSVGFLETLNNSEVLSTNTNVDVEDPAQGAVGV